MEIVFNPLKTNADKVQLAIANVGHDTEKHRTTAKAYILNLDENAPKGSRWLEAI